MKIAIIETGGKQYLVTAGQKIQIEKLEGKIGEKLDFDKVFLSADLPVETPAKAGDGKIEIGKPYLDGRKISAEIVAQKRLKKVTVFRYHSKTRYRKKKGHRQHVSVVKISNF